MKDGGLVKKSSPAIDKAYNDAQAIYGLLDEAKSPVKVADICQALNLSLTQYRVARRTIVADAGVYVTQDGLVLQRYVSDEEQRYWHLAWSLGLFEASGQQLAMDEDLLQDAPARMTKLLNEGKLPDHARLERLVKRTRDRLTTLLKLVEMYKGIETTLKLALLPAVSSNDWKKGLSQVRKALKSAS